MTRFPSFYDNDLLIQKITYEELMITMCEKPNKLIFDPIKYEKTQYKNKLSIKSFEKPKYLGCDRQGKVWWMWFNGKSYAVKFVDK